MASFVFVLLLPVMFFLHSLFQNSWHQVEQTMLEKHQLISEALVEPFTLFISSRQQSLKTLGQGLSHLSNDVSVMLDRDKREQRVQQIMDKHLRPSGTFISLSYSPGPGFSVERLSTTDTSRPHSEMPDYSELTLAKLPPASNVISGQDMLSPVFISTISDEPVVLIRHEILNQHSIVDGVIYAEISLKKVSRMCAKINFGKKGHCAVVDSTGHVVSHPREDWVDTAKDLSKVSIVQAMLAGKSGTTEFYSPALKADMVAGFSAIPALGWGVMIPQPKSELTRTLGNFRFNTLVWLAFGVLVALIVSVLLTRKITQPINLLMKRTMISGNNYEMVSLGKAPKSTPSEIKQLWASFSKLLAGLQSSNNEVRRLNASLQEEIQIATAELREMNKHLFKTSTEDYLTSLSNRRHFNQKLENVLACEIGNMIGIMIIDIDNFKFINDQFGHEAGDLALKHLAAILKQSERPCDMVARLGGDEFIIYVSNPTDDALATLAENIRESVEQSAVVLPQQSLKLTLSMGTVNQLNDGNLSLETLLCFADRAMYHSKASGRNKVSAHRFENDSMEKAVS